MQLNAPSLDRLVVGLDDPSADRGVLAWATQEAAARHCALRVLATRGEDTDDFLDEAADATLLIVGTEPIAGGGRRGSCPVVVVRGTPRDQLRRIVVGVDSSNASAAALDWAIAEAARHGATVKVVHAWQQPAEGERSLRGSDLRQADAQCIADLAADLYEVGDEPVIERRAVQGLAVDVLIAESMGADLLVVGSRGPSGYRTLQFGSVALAAIQRSDCPVVVVHPRLIASGTGDPGDTHRSRRS